MRTRRPSYGTHWFVGPWRFYEREWPRYPISPVKVINRWEPQLSWILMTSNVPSIACKFSVVVIYTLLKKAHVEIGSQSVGSFS